MILNGTIAILIKYGYWKSQIVISNSSVYQKQLNREVVENLDHLPRKFINKLYFRKLLYFLLLLAIPIMYLNSCCNTIIN